MAFQIIVVLFFQKSIGEQFKRETAIHNLPPIMKFARRKKLGIDEVEKADIGLCALFGADYKQEESH